jgi:3-carboxy-cis,cis-muconate cycloisomerase
MLGAEDPGLIAATTSYRSTREAFSARGMVQAYLEFEAALAQAQARAGVITAQDATAIAAACSITHFDFVALNEGTAQTGYPIVPLVAQLSRSCGSSAGASVHLGATTQDVMDTALVLILTRELSPVINRLKASCEALAEIADKHRATIMAGRTKGQQAAPTTFGFKVAIWLDQQIRQLHHLSEAIENVRFVQFGGAVGTLAAHGPGALEVRALLADELGLRVPDITWHVTRDRLCQLVQAIAGVANSIAKAALDIASLSATEVDEVHEPYLQGRGASSCMPQKRNPVVCESLLEGARLITADACTLLTAQVHDHDRGLGFAHIERQVVANSTALIAGCSELFTDVLSGIEINEEAMTRNMELAGGGLMAETAFAKLILHLGRLQAHEIVSIACDKARRTGDTLEYVLNEELKAMDLEVDFKLNPMDNLSAADVMISEVLASSSKILRSV